ncbi:phytoene desaturase family protein [Streptacidiphilus jiangxiensis]|uniref:Pyridine nucleotide-disulfide oxidoreductase domain-containing protein 2 n=1 Tax=Streptacidiphilus jiangxiensis TaxID=235985 RepID=A0A1H7HEW4_STRJI|nr:NAD(P)/FAD-dependent oxidoreductase [Streptacidiphilus jiangxiensis]SEK46785.1 Phytoene dehydrogenase-related protein [Streptacidiphilus jiangxiensis]
MPDAIVIGAGPNGLVAANLLADAGWEVEVLEAQPLPGGAVRSDNGLDPAFVHDLFSSFYPLAKASPAIATLDLERHGLAWSHAPTVLAHPLPDGRCATLHRGPTATRDQLEDSFGAADAAAWERLTALWSDLDPHLLRSLFTPFPPLKPAAAMAARLRTTELLPTARFMTLPVRRLAQEEFTEPGAGLLLAGCALHTDLAPEAAGSGAFGWLMAMLGQHVGWPVPVGGSSNLTHALVRRLESIGGRVHCNQRVEEVIVRGGRALGVRTADGQCYRAVRAVLADVAATTLYGQLVDWEHLPPELRRDLRRFQWDFSTFKVDWALSGPIPWTAPSAARAGTVHLGADMDELSDYAHQVATGRLPRHPFALLGQMTTADSSRSPDGTESAWVYTHVPQRIAGDLGDDAITGRWNSRESEAMADRLEQQVERFAPGFRQLITTRRILAPPTLQDLDENLVGGALNGGTSAIHQQLVFRPSPGTGRPETPIERLYLASASAHPGGGVHGACGANAARAALRSHRVMAGRILSPGLSAAQRLLSGHPPRT